MKIYLPLILILVCGFGAFSQTKIQKTNLKTVINQYAAKVVLNLNKTGSMGGYKVKGKNIFYSDIDEDGDFDAIVELFFCERSSCHPTTQSSKLAIFTNGKQSYKFAADEKFELIGKINSINRTKISIDIYDLEGDDPQCCPEIKRFEVYEFKNGKLVKSK